MSDGGEFSLDGAREAEERGDLATWVSRFLASPGSDNAPLGEELAQRGLWWLGPVRVPLHRLHRLAGPPDAPVLCPVDDDYWRDDVDEMRERVEDGWEPPPVIATWSEGRLVLEDGNHRIESLRRAGVSRAWTLIGVEELDDGLHDTDLGMRLRRREP
jgi:hypothetical protein